MSENYRYYAQKMAEHRRQRETPSHLLDGELQELIDAVEWCEKIWAIEERIEKGS